MTKLISCADFSWKQCTSALKMGQKYDQTLVWKCLSNNPLAISLNMESNSSFKSFKLSNCLSLDHKRSQEHSFTPSLQSIRKQVAKGLFQRLFQGLVIWPNIRVSFLIEVHCYQLKSSKDVNLVRLVYKLFWNYCLNNLEKCTYCFGTFYSK